MRRAVIVVVSSLFAVLLTAFGSAPAGGAEEPVAATLPVSAAAPSSAPTMCADLELTRTCHVTVHDLGPGGYVDVPVTGGIPVSLIVYGGQAGGVNGHAEAGPSGGLVAVRGTTPWNAVAVRFEIGQWGEWNENGEASYASWVYPGGDTAGILTAPGGGDPNGAVVAAEMQTLADTGGGEGDGSALLILGGDQAIYPGCFLGGGVQRLYDVPTGVDRIAFVATGGGGTHGHNRGPQEGAGGVVAGVFDVSGIVQLQYWVGCSGYTLDGAGFGQPGQAGEAEDLGFDDGGAGGGTTLVQHIDGVVEVLAAAGGGGGVGGNDTSTPWEGQGGDGGSSLGKYGDRWDSHGGGHHAGQGVGGCAACNGTSDDPDPDGSDGTSSGGYEAAGGGGGGSGWPRGGAGGGIDTSEGPGGGGGAGASYLSQTRATLLTWGPDSRRGRDGTLVMIPVSPPPTTSLTVVKSVSGAAAGAAHGPYIMHVTCMKGTTHVFDGTFQIGIGPAAGHTIDDLLIGAACTVTETWAADATTPAGPQQVTLTADPATVTMGNAYAAAELAITLHSALAGDPAHPEPGPLPLGDLDVHIACTLDGVAVALPAPVSAGGVLTFTGSQTWASSGAAVTIPGVPVNSDCTVTHSAGPASVTYTVDGGSPSAQAARVTVASTGSSVGVHDAYPLVPFTVRNASTGTDSPPAVVYDITMACTYLGSAVDLTASQAAFPLGTGEAVTVDNVPVGAECTTTETDPGIAIAVEYTPSRTLTIAAGTEQTITNVFGAVAPQTDTPTAADADAGPDPADARPTIAPTATAPLTIDVQVTGDAAWAANTGLHVDLTCTIGGEPATSLGPDGTVSLRFAADGTALSSWGATQLAALPVGSVCTAVQTATGGATSVAYTPAAADGGAQLTIDADGTTLTIVNTFDAATLTIATRLAGNDLEGRGNTAFLLEQRCRFNGEPLDVDDDAPALAGQFWLHGNDSRSFPGLPVGAECDVHETDALGVTLIEPGPHQRGTIGADGLTVTFTNVYDVTPLRVRQPLLGEGAATYGHLVPPSARRPGHVVVACWTDESRRTRVPLPQDGVVPLTDDPATLSAPANAVCEIIGSSPTVATDTVSSPPVTLTLGDDHVLELSRIFDLATLSLDKRVIGDDDGARFTFTIACSWEDAVAGARLPVPLNADASPTPKLGDGGHAVRRVIAGADCTVTEADARDVRSVAIAVTESGGPVRMVAARTATVAMAADTPAHLAYTNVMAGAMPVTGADAAGALVVAGILVLMGALLLLVRRRRRVP